MNNYFGIQWWENEQNKRENRMRSNDIERLNHYLQKILHKLDKFVDDKSLYGKYENRRVLVQCSIWNLKYINNFESLDVAELQILLINNILNTEDVDNKNYYKNEVEKAEYMFRNIDYSRYVTLKRSLN